MFSFCLGHLSYNAHSVLKKCLGFVLIVLAVGGCTRTSEVAPSKEVVSVQAFKPAITCYEQLMGCHFTSHDEAPLSSISTEKVPVPNFPGCWALWSSSGRDYRGHLWFGVSAHDVPASSAHLYEYEPGGPLIDRGNVVEELQKAGVLRPGEGQMKIHSRIVQGADGHLYFSSMDEQGENTDGSRLPTWGGHLWRLRLPENRWEHLFSTPEALIAVSGAGRWIYTLGYFRHVIYQFDCHTGQKRSVIVGAAGGHISRNILTDLKGHVYVPRLKSTSSGEGFATTLVELNEELQQVGETPLQHYTQSRDDHSHGITGVQPLADESFVFTTDQGFLYRVTPLATPPALVEPLGWLHPEGKAYVASLFTSDGKQAVMAASRRQDKYEWVTFDLATRRSKAVPMPLTNHRGQTIKFPLLYGSITRDDDGSCYLVGAEGNQPLVLKVFANRIGEASTR